MLELENAPYLATPGAPSARNVAAKTPGRTFAPLGGLETPVAPQSKASAKRRPLGEISNRAQRPGQAPATMLKSIMVADASAALDLPPIERMHLASPSPALCLDCAGAELEAQVNALASFSSVLSASDATIAPDPLLRSPIVPDAPPTPRHLLAELPSFSAAAPTHANAAPLCAVVEGLAEEEERLPTSQAHTPAAHRGPITSVLTPYATASDACLEAELDFDALELVPLTPWTAEQERESAHSEDEGEARAEQLRGRVSSSNDPEVHADLAPAPSVRRLGVREFTE